VVRLPLCEQLHLCEAVPKELEQECNRAFLVVHDEYSLIEATRTSSREMHAARGTVQSLARFL
jgi:hypothetical protein